MFQPPSTFHTPAAPLPQRDTLMDTQLQELLWEKQIPKGTPFSGGGWALSGLTHIQFSSPSSRGDHTFGSLAVKQGHVTSSEQLVRSRSDVMCITSKVKHLLVGLSSRSLFSVLGSPELPPEAKVPWNAELPWKPTVKDARARSKIPF